MSIYGGFSVGVIHVDRIAEARRRDLDSADIPFFYGSNREAFAPLGLKIDPRMKVMAPQLCEGARNGRGDVERGDVGCIGLSPSAVRTDENRDERASVDVQFGQWKGAEQRKTPAKSFEGRG